MHEIEQLTCTPAIITGRLTQSTGILCLLGGIFAKPHISYISKDTELRFYPLVGTQQLVFPADLETLEIGGFGDSSSCRFLGKGLPVKETLL
ncbi:MAG TPA: hypothetical protein V6C57_07605 [Coleofasciculaceae cyanobacterium]